MKNKSVLYVVLSLFCASVLAAGLTVVPSIHASSDQNNQFDNNQNNFNGDQGNQGDQGDHGKDGGKGGCNSPTPTPTPTPKHDPCDDHRGDDHKDGCESPTPTPTVTPSPTQTPAPTPQGNGYGLPGDGRSDGRSDGKSSCPSCTAAPSTNGQVLGATTDFAGTGVADDILMNVVGAFGGLSTAAGLVLSAKKRS